MSPRPAIPFLLCICLVLTGFSTGLKAASFAQARAAFDAGDFTKSAASWQELIARDGASAARLYNLGNAQFKLNRTGEAILSWERAAALAPRDPDIQRNLTLARQAAAKARPGASQFNAPPLPWWEKPVFWLGLHEWSWLLAAALLVMAAAALAWGFAGTRTRFPLRRSTPWIFAAGSLVALACAAAVSARRGEKNLAILTSAEPVLKLSPFDSAQAVDAPGLPAGQRVLVDARHGDWLHVRLPGTSTTTAGWVPGKDAGLVFTDL